MTSGPPVEEVPPKPAAPAPSSNTFDDMPIKSAAAPPSSFSSFDDTPLPNKASAAALVIGDDDLSELNAGFGAPAASQPVRPRPMLSSQRNPPKKVWKS